MSSAELEEKRQLLLDTSKKLEIKARKLLAQAAETRAQYEALAKQQERIDSSDEAAGGKGSSSHQRDQEQNGKSSRATTDPAEAKSEKVMRKRKHHDSTSGGTEKEGPSTKKKKTKKDKEKLDGSKVRGDGDLKNKLQKRAEESKREEEGQKGVKKMKDHQDKKKRKEKKQNRKGDEGDKVKREALDATTGGEPGLVEDANWNIGELGGGSSRQDKFLRLLGGKKGAAAEAKTAGRTNTCVSAARQAEADIQRQFEVGMKMKSDGGGKRRGLGA